MSEEKEIKTIINNPWDFLKDYTDARIALGRAGVSIPTSSLLDFQLAHAQAQDAVHLPLDINLLKEQFKSLTFNAKLFNEASSKELVEQGQEAILLNSQAASREIYLQRPDLGRLLDLKSKEKLKNKYASNISYDLSIIVADGLSSLAIKENAFNYIQLLLKALADDTEEWKLSPLSIVTQGRVAVGDEVGEILKSKISLILIGERPGLSSPNSLGLYLTYNPKLGSSDAKRNCISNVRTNGLSYEEAIQKTMYLLKEARRRKLSGVNLKDRTKNQEIINFNKNENFLIK